MKQTLKSIAIISLFAMVIQSCKKNKDDVDTSYPDINLEYADAFPTQCGIVQRGQTFNFRARLSDNRELGSVSIDVHHNFDHHSHSTEVNDCVMDAKKTPVSPFLLIKDQAIPAGQTNYEANIPIMVPADVDAGDYHFLVRLTDKEGWQTIKGISIKIQ